MPIPKKTKTISAYFTEDDTGQIRAAVQAVGKIEGYPSITALVEAATLRELRRLQRKYNGGRRWCGAPAGSMRPGQRTRDEIRQSQMKLDKQPHER